MTKAKSGKPGPAKSRPDKLLKGGVKSGAELSDEQLQKASGGLVHKLGDI